MSLVPAKCPECGGNINIDPNKKAANCEFCKQPFIVEEAINNFNTTYNITNHNDIKADVVNVYNESKNIDNLLKRAEDYINNKNYDEAEKYLNRILDENIDHSIAKDLLNKLPEIRELDEATDALSRSLQSYSKMIAGETRSCRFDLRLGSNSTYVTTLIKLYNRVASLGGDAEGVYKEKLEDFFNQLKNLFMDGSWWDIEVPKSRFSIEMPYYHSGIDQEVICKKEIISVFLRECLKTKNSNIGDSFTYLPKAYVELKAYWNDINIPDKLDSTDIGRGGPKWSVLGNYAYRWTGDADTDDLFHKLGRNIKSGEELERYLDEAQQNYRKEVATEYKPLNKCPKCLQPLSLFGKCKNSECINYGKKIFNNQDLNDDIHIRWSVLSIYYR